MLEVEGFEQSPVMNDALADRAIPEWERTPNVPLLRKTLEHITAHPEEWDQETWALQTSCGTVGCLAGWAVTLAGHNLVFTKGCDCEVCDAEESIAAETCIVDGQLRTIHKAAEHALGLTQEQACSLFNGGNNLHTLWAEANAITHGEIVIPADVKARSGL